MFAGMQIVRTVSDMAGFGRQWRQKGVCVALVPTMGALHQGHLSLVERARKLAGPRGKVVVSIYVNPTQFAPSEDFSRYPRDLRRDAGLCRGAGVDAIFAPTDAEMYPAGEEDAFSTYVVEGALSQTMEGASRPTHFRGVTTVVAKLFNIVQPQTAIFGAKDYQQAAVIQRMVRDLNFPLKVVVAPTFRESDGLAMSSRNQYLTGSLRGQAVALSQGLAKAREKVRQDRSVSANTLKAQLKRLIEQQPDARVDYIEFFDPGTLKPVKQAKRGTHMALAVFIGRTRLIDNGRL